MLVEITLPIQDITGNAQLLSMYRSNSMLQKGNDVPLDDTASNSDDEAVLKKYLKVVCSEIAGIVSGYTSGLEVPAFEFDVEAEGAKSVVWRMEMPETWNTHTLVPLEEAIKDSVENYLLMRVAKHKANEFQSYEMDYQTGLSKVRTYIHQRTTGIKRSMNMF